MANHVHLLVWPRVSLSRFLQTLKGYTAREANRLLGRTGQPFWQAESYDHSVSDDRELDRIKAYIENNPVKAGLVAKAEAGSLLLGCFLNECMMALRAAIAAGRNDPVQ